MSSTRWKYTVTLAERMGVQTMTERIRRDRWLKQRLLLKVSQYHRQKRMMASDVITAIVSAWLVDQCGELDEAAREKRQAFTQYGDRASWL